MKKIWRIAILGMMGLFAFSAHADKCVDPIVDEMKIITGDEKVAIEKSMATLTSRGADVHVHVVDSFHRNDQQVMHKSLDEYARTMKGRCKTWKSQDGGLKNSFILVAVAPNQRASLIYNGDQWQSSIEPVRAHIYNDTMNPRFREGKIGLGVAKALTDIVDVTSLKASEVGKPVTINQATDYSGVASFLKWGLFLAFIGGLLALLYYVYKQYEARRSAQRNAQTERGKCTQSINNFDGAIAILSAKVRQSTVSLEWKARLLSLIDQANAAYQAATQDFTALNRSANNPDTPRLSVEEYRGMEMRFAECAERFAKADRRREGVESEFNRAERGEPIVPTDVPKSAEKSRSNSPSSTFTPAGRSTGAGRSRAEVQKPSSPTPSRRPAPSTPASPAHTRRTAESARRQSDVHHHDDSTNVFAPIIVNNDNRGRDRGDDYPYRRRDEPSDPVIATPHFDPPPRARESEVHGRAVDWGKTSDGNGVTQSFGNTTEGHGRSVGWDASPSRGGTSY